MEGGICVYIVVSAFHRSLKILLTQLWHRVTVPSQRKITACGLLTSWGTADGGVGGGGIWPAELCVSQGLWSSRQRLDHCSKCLDSHGSRSKVYLCDVMHLAHRETILSPLLIGVAQFQTSCHPRSHRWHELEFLCYLVDSAALGPTQPPVHWVPGSFLGVKRQRCDADHSPHLS